MATSAVRRTAVRVIFIFGVAAILACFALILHLSSGPPHNRPDTGPEAYQTADQPECDALPSMRPVIDPANRFDNTTYLKITLRQVGNFEQAPWQRVVMSICPGSGDTRQNVMVVTRTYRQEDRQMSAPIGQMSEFIQTVPPQGIVLVTLVPADDNNPARLAPLRIQAFSNGQPMSKPVLDPAVP